jgi:hypothetical protein
MSGRGCGGEPRGGLYTQGRLNMLGESGTDAGGNGLRAWETTELWGGAGISIQLSDVVVLREDASTTAC